MYTILYHRFVWEKDFKKIPKGDQKKILKSVHKKLTSSPETFGKPLVGDLKGYYRLRIDPYRVIYKVHKNTVEVFVLLVGLRKDFIAYVEAAKRLSLL